MAQEFNFEYEETNVNDIQHLLDIVEAYDLESSLEFGTLQELDQQQLAQLEQELLAQIETLKQKQRRDYRPCYIGPYANKICTICGLDEPKEN